MSVTRPLPPRLSLEYERKEAKALLRRLRAGNPDALARLRAQRPGLELTNTMRARLADAQLIIAREYGFASWPRLVRYFGDVARHQLTPRELPGSNSALDATVRGLLKGHAVRRMWAGRTLAAYVPRFYGLRPDDSFDAAVTDDDARLAVARMYGAASWDMLLERLEEIGQPDPWAGEPMRDVGTAMAAGDLGALQRIVEAHPRMLHPTDQDVARGRTLIAIAVWQEQRRGMPAMRPIMEWLAARGFDRQLELNRRLCGRIAMPVDEVRDLLGRGADPDWVAPNGFSVLEHALVRYWNGDAVDLLAAHTTPRRALWIAAGLGDVNGVRSFLDRAGAPTAAARRLRPDFDALGRGMMPPLPEPDDDEILMEAFLVAAWNGRIAVLEYLVSRGFPVDSLVYATPVINIAVGNAWVPVVECLVRCGADLDLRGWHPDQTARECAREMFGEMPDDDARRRIVELCGMDPRAVLAERDARVTVPTRSREFDEALALAADDAAHLGQPEVRPENLLVGLLRGGRPLHFVTSAVSLDLPGLRRELADRLRDAGDFPAGGELPFSAGAHAAVESAIAAATERRRDEVDGVHLLYALLRGGKGPAAGLLVRHGADPAALSVVLEQWV